MRLQRKVAEGFREFWAGFWKLRMAGHAEFKSRYPTVDDVKPALPIIRNVP